MSEYYGDVTVIQKSRLRVSAEHDGPMTKALMLSILRQGSFDDIPDEETLEILSVEGFDPSET